MKRLGNLLISLGIFIIVLLLVFILSKRSYNKIPNENRTVFIKKTHTGFQLYRNGKPFFIKGAGGNGYFEELASAGGNTIRVYDTIRVKQVLDEAEKYNLAVIVDIPLPRYSEKYNLYSDVNNNDILKQRITTLIRKYRRHPALLMWNLGNEINYPLTIKKNDFIITYNDLIDIIHNEDPEHPVCTSIACVDKKQTAAVYLHSPQIDLLSFNVFGGIDNEINRKLPQIFFLFGVKPYFIGEWGINGPWECEVTYWKSPIEPASSKKAEQLINRYKIIDQINDNACLGSLGFFWGQKQECTHTWFSIFSHDSLRSEVSLQFENIWKKVNLNPNPIGLDYMLVDEKGARDNIIFAPNEARTAEIRFIKQKNDNVFIKWALYPDSWNVDSNGEDNQKSPNEILSAFKFFEGNSATFITPGKDGPYRIFAYIYDDKGNFATTNTPFYVLSPK